MIIDTVAVGDKVMNVEATASLEDVWRFLDSNLSACAGPVAVVIQYEDGECHFGRIFDVGLYHAFWETPAKLQRYLRGAGVAV
jgi:hypothetical protein